MKISIVIDQLGTAFAVGKNGLKFAQALKEYVDYLSSEQKMNEIETELNFVYQLLSQQEKSYDLLFTRILTHLEHIYTKLEVFQHNVWNKNKVRHKKIRFALRWPIFINGWGTLQTLFISMLWKKTR